MRAGNSEACGRSTSGRSGTFALQRDQRQGDPADPTIGVGLRRIHRLGDACFQIANELILLVGRRKGWLGNVYLRDICGRRKAPAGDSPPKTHGDCPRPDRTQGGDSIHESSMRLAVAVAEMAIAGASAPIFRRH